MFNTLQNLVKLYLKVKSKNKGISENERLVFQDKNVLTFL